MKAHDWLIAIMVVIFLFLPLALPYVFQFDYWAQSTIAWIIHAVIGVILAAYVFYRFLRTRRSLLKEIDEKEADS